MELDSSHPRKTLLDDVKEIIKCLVHLEVSVSNLDY